MEALSPVRKDASVYGRDACSGTQYNLNEANWWSAEFQKSSLIQMVELLPLSLDIMGPDDYP